eukprot:scaffold230800_cov40-Prasinocladus_malaysianus.AAC.2
MTDCRGRGSTHGIRNGGQRRWGLAQTPPTSASYTWCGPAAWRAWPMKTTACQTSDLIFRAKRVVEVAERHLLRKICRWRRRASR